ncbi:MAG: isopentenyl phosphate kinase [Candidatus Bathyarchaeota archaeon]|nr:isopentenyl phosphate kinase [Candidatus Bathyarchaeota archaeon]
MGERVAETVLKLGGSVITVKEKASTPDTRAIRRLSREIARACCKSMIMVHGGGSFGHFVASKYKIKEGYTNPEQLFGFSKTRQKMVALNKLVVDALINNNIPAASVQSSACFLTEEGRVSYISLEPIIGFLKLNLIPVLYGDAVLDTKLGFTILSGDQIASKLAIALKSERIILGVDVDGLYTSDPKLDLEAKLIEKISLRELKKMLTKIGGARTPDVTGGMLGKMVEIIPAIERGIKVSIINAKKPGRIYKALKNKDVLGTKLKL